MPIYRAVQADLETPVSAYLKVAKPPYSFLLESVEGGERIARYSFIGTEPYKVVKTGPGQPEGRVDPLIPVEEEMSRYKLVPVPELPRFHGGGVGYLAYDTVSYFEPRVPMMPEDPQGLPESVFMFADTMLVFDHLQHDIKVVSHVRLDGDVESAYAEATTKINALVERLAQPLSGPRLLLDTPRGRGTPSDFDSNFTLNEYEDVIGKCIDYIYEGDCIQVVNSQRFSRRTEAPPFEIYRALRSVNPSPYMYFLQMDDFHIVGAAIETVAQVEDGMWWQLIPSPAHAPGGPLLEEDAAWEEELRNSVKQRAEHIMLVDLGRNDIGRVSVPGTVKVTQLMDVERFSHVMHLVSHVEGQLKPEMTVYDALRSCFPAGTVSGAPKIRAMEIIAEVEGEMRGPYGGAVGYFSYSGNMGHGACSADGDLQGRDNVRAGGRGHRFRQQRAG